MKKSLVLLCSLAGLAACAQFQPPSLAEGNIVSTEEVRTGYGVIGSVALAVPSKTWRLHLLMDDGHSQSLETDDPIFLPDQRVEITPQRRVALVSGTTLSKKTY